MLPIGLQQGYTVSCIIDIRSGYYWSQLYVNITRNEW